MVKPEKMVIVDSDIPLRTLDEILLKKVDFKENDLYDLYSFPHLTEIISNEKTSLEKNYFLYSINKMLILHPINQIIFLTHFTNHQHHIEKTLTKIFPNINIKILGYNIVASEYLEFFDDTNKEKYSLKMDKTLVFRCTDGRLSRMYANSLKDKNPLKITNGHYICIPGSTLPLTVCEERKILIKHIKEYIHKNKIEEIKIEHHGPDCGAFVAYHRIEKNLDTMRSYVQHLANIERVWKTFIKTDKEISSRYFEFEPEKDKLIEKSLCIKSDNTSEGIISKIHYFDFKNWKVIEFAKV